ncbi:hypothetical protein QAD02_007187, partial [Eretmocerus hayati]
MTAKIRLLREEEEPPVEEELHPDELEDSLSLPTKRVNLLYTHNETPQSVNGELRNSRDSLKIMCDLNSSGELDEDFSEEFTKFIQSSRLLDFQSLSQLIHRADSICSDARKHILDSLPFIGSNAAVAIMGEMIINRSVEITRGEFWIIALTFLPRPDLQTLHILSHLFDQKDVISETQFVLSYASVIHSYCTNRAFRCSDIEPIMSFAIETADIVRQGCEARQHDIGDIRK